MFIVIVNLSFGNPVVSPTGQMSYTRRAGPILKFIYNGTPLQYSCLENPMGGGAWKAAVHGVTRSQTHEHTHTLSIYFLPSTGFG